MSINRRQAAVGDIALHPYNDFFRRILSILALMNEHKLLALLRLKDLSKGEESARLQK